MVEAAGRQRVEESVKQVLKGLGSAVVVCVPLGLYFHFWMRGTVLFTAFIVGVLGTGILIVVGTRSDEADAAADLAWRAAAPDLPPVSDRRSMEAAQFRRAGPSTAGAKSAPGEKSAAAATTPRR
jgi:hypothetical protein